MGEEQREQLQLLKEAEESSGWKIRLGLAATWLEGKRKEVARFLRQGDLHKATLEQGKIDGFTEFDNFLSEFKKELKDEQEDPQGGEIPKY